MKFVGMWCALTSLEYTLENQLKEDKCPCAACWIAFCTLYRNCEKNYPDAMPSHTKRVKKMIERYWVDLDKRNKRVSK
jgi:hypothetical protein